MSLLDGFDAERADFGRLLRAIDTVRAAPREELQNLHWVHEWVCSVGLAHLPPLEETYGDLAHLANASHQGIGQYPLEFARWLHLLGGQGIRSYLEIGCFNGATCSLAAAYLQRFEPALRVVTLDLWPWFLFEREVCSLLPIEYRLGARSYSVRGQSFDAVFIDGDHSFEWAWADYRNAGEPAKVCGLHDIASAHYAESLEIGGVPAVWELLKRDAAGPGVQFLEFIDHPTRDRFGIGVRLQAPPAI